VFEDAIERLAQAGITKGCNPPANTKFCPDDSVSRGQMAAFLVRALNLPAYNGPDRFIDDNGNVFEDAIERLAQAGITKGCNPPANTKFCPDDSVSRGQMAAFLKRALD
jgi:S-layer homology domain